MLRMLIRCRRACGMWPLACTGVLLAPRQMGHSTGVLIKMSSPVRTLSFGTFIATESFPVLTIDLGAQVDIYTCFFEYLGA